MNIIHYSIRSFFTNEYYSIIRFASKRLFVATLVQVHSQNQWNFTPSWAHNGRVSTFRKIKLQILRHAEEQNMHHNIILTGKSGYSSPLYE